LLWDEVVVCLSTHARGLVSSELIYVGGSVGSSGYYGHVLWRLGCTMFETLETKPVERVPVWMSFSSLPLAIVRAFGDQLEMYAIQEK
jgi:hypothetical protein